MILREDAVLAAVSGGPDSTALLHLLCGVRETLGLRLGVAHLDHSLRGEASKEDARFVESLCNTLGVPFHLKKTDVQAEAMRLKCSLEDAGRRARYAFFHQTAKKHGYNRIALGHHRDDNAELVLMNLLRGSGATGLSGMAPIRKDGVIRPLIRCSRQQVLEYLGEHGHDYRIDDSNLDPAFLRNRVRKELLPMLERDYNPNVRSALNRLAETLRQEDDWISSLVDRAFADVCIEDREGRVVLDAVALALLHRAPAFRVLRRAVGLVKGDLMRVTLRHIHKVAELISGPGGVDLPGLVRAERSGNRIVFHKKDTARGDKKGRTPTIPKYCYEATVPGELRIPEAGMVLRFSETDACALSDLKAAGQDTEFFDMQSLTFPLVLRNVLPGDRFRPLGMAGTRKVKSFFIDKKTPGEERTNCPVMLSGGRIVWLVGHRIDDSVKITERTKRVLSARLLLA